MTLTDELKILDDKMKAKAQFDLDMEATKISAVLSGELKKYEYLTGEDLGYKLGVVENLSLNVLHLAKFLIKYLVKKTKKKNTFEKINKY